MTTELGRLVNALCNAAIAYGEQTEYASDEHSAMLEAEKALLEYVEKREVELAEALKQKEKFDADASIVCATYNKLRDNVENLAAAFESGSPPIGVRSHPIARKLRSIL